MVKSLLNPATTPTSELDSLLADIRACRICVDSPIGRPLPHEPRPVVWGSATARILIAGQAPGTRVHASGKPFADPSGDRLRSWMGISEADFYDESRIAIVPMGFCFPGLDARGGDLPPRRECAPAWRHDVLARMPAVDLVLAVGLHAQQYHLGARAKRSLTETVAGWRTILEGPAPVPVLPLPHPSWRNSGWIKRNPWFEAELIPTLKRLVASRLGGGVDNFRLFEHS